MKLLVTGGYGFIGSNFIIYCLEEDLGIEIVNVDYCGIGSNPSNIPQGITISSRYTFYQVDIADKEKMSSIFELERPEVVINFAAQSHVDRSIEDNSSFIHSNILGVNVLLDLCLKCNTKFHQVGTDEVYGSLSKDSPPSTERDLLQPRNPYAATKAAADLLCLSYYHTHKLPITITRGSNTYGPRQWSEKLIPLFCKKLAKSEKVPVYGDGKNIREWLYVNDHVRGILSVLMHGKEGEIYNIGSGVLYENIEITRMILNFFNYGDEMIDYVPDRKGHDFMYSLDTSKVYERTGWSPMVDPYRFTEYFHRTLRWYKQTFVY